MPANSLIRVLVVDDSAFVRKVIREILQRSPLIEVVGVARNGKEALEMAAQLKPDVITLDLMMPEMDGVTFLREQNRRARIPAVVVSIASESGDLVMDALQAGALEFVQKPTALATDRVYEIAPDLINKVKLAASIQADRLPQPFNLPAVTAPAAALPERVPAFQPHRRVDAVVIGVSTGGPQALTRLLPTLPADFPVPIAVVLHMPVGYTGPFARRLNDLSALEILEAQDGDEMRPGRVLLAPAGRHLVLESLPNRPPSAHLTLFPADHLHRPSVDVLFQSAAQVYDSRLLGVVLTGMGSDGVEGAATIKLQGGLVFAEAEESCVVYGMPRAIVEAGLADRIVPLNQMAQVIMEAL